MKNKMSGQHIAAVLLSLCSVQAAYGSGIALFDPMSVRYEGKFFETGGQWVIEAEKKQTGLRSTVLKKLYIEFQGQSFQLPPRIEGLALPVLQSIEFKRQISTHFQLDDKAEVRFIFTMKFGLAEYCDYQITGRSVNNLLVVHFARDGKYESMDILDWDYLCEIDQVDKKNKGKNN